MNLVVAAGGQTEDLHFLLSHDYVCALINDEDIRVFLCEFALKASLVSVHPVS